MKKKTTNFMPWPVITTIICFKKHCACIASCQLAPFVEWNTPTNIWDKFATSVAFNLLTITIKDRRYLDGKHLNMRQQEAVGEEEGFKIDSTKRS